MSTTTLLIGLGKGGTALMPYLLANNDFDLVAVCDSSSYAIGLPIAERCQLPIYTDAALAVKELRPQIVIDATGDPSLPSTLYEVRPAGTSVVTGEAGRLLWELLSAIENQRRCELRFTRLLSDMRSGLVVVQDSKIRFGNAAFLKLVGYTEVEILGHPYAEILHPDVRERDLKYGLDRLAGRDAPEEYETCIRHADGSEREVMVRARRSDWDGRPASLLILTDVTSLRALQRERERFFRFMVHELRAPLSPLVTAVSLLRDEAVQRDPKRLDALAKLLTRSTTRLQSFVDEFLDLSKLDQERLAVTQEPVDLGEVIAEVIESQQVLAEDKGLALVVKPWDAFPIRGDRFAIRTLVQNLVNNGIKYTRQGSVTVAVAAEEEGFTVSIADSGAGLTEEERQTLFQEFGRIHRTAGVKGSGLGLALVKRLAVACGGDVWAESPGKDKGSTFAFRLPYVFGDPHAVKHH